MNTHTPILRVTNLTKRFGKTTAVDNISFSLNRGDVVGFVGPNGAGKTTTMRMMMTLDTPDGGDIAINGTSILDYPEVARRNIGYMPDSLPSNTDITAHEYIDFFGRAYGLRGRKLAQAVEETEEFTQVSKIRDKTLRALSKGMKQRVSLARTLIHNPDIMLLDEPAAGLDPRARIEFKELVRALSENGKTLLISSHILPELAEMCKSFLIIEHGKLLHRGGIGEIASAADSDEKTSTIAVRALSGGSAASSDDVRMKLLEIPGVKQVRLVADEWLIECNGEADDERCADMLRKLLDKGIAVVSFTPYKQNLEDIFMTITRGDVA